MKVLKVNPHFIDEKKMEEIARIISQGKIVIIPTETVYGLACDSQDESAIRKLYELKGKRENKPFAYHLAELEWVEKFFFLDKDCLERLNLFKDLWPGPLTLILKTRDGNNIGLRIPDNEITQKIILACKKPLFIPSANPSNELPPSSVEEALFYFWDKVDLIVDGGNARYGISSLVLDISSPSIRIIREGPPYINYEIKKRIEKLNYKSCEV